MLSCKPALIHRMLSCCPALLALQENVRRTFNLMSRRGLVRAGDLVVVVTDLRPPEGDIIRSLQVRHVQ